MTSYPDLKRGSAWEYRVHRAAFLSGWYVRRGINLRERVMGSPQTMAEVDIVGLGFDPGLSPRTVVGECKDRKGGAKEADRIVWLLGLSRLLRADHVLFAKTRLTGATIQFAQPFGVALWDEAAVRDIEQRFGLAVDQGFFGSFNISLCEDVLRPSRKASSIKSKALRSAWDYLSGAYWYRGTPTRTKLLRGYFEALREAKGLDAPTRSGFAAEGLIALLVSAYTTAGQLSRMSPAQSLSQQEAAFTAGVADAAALREIAGRADDYYQDALRQVARKGKNAAALEIKVPRLANTIAEAPDWHQAYLAFARRLGERPLLSGEVLRYADVVLFEQFLAGNEVRDLLKLLFTRDLGALQTALELGALFVKRIWGFDDEILDRVLAGNGGHGATKTKSGRQFDGKLDQPKESQLFETETQPPGR